MRKKPRWRIALTALVMLSLLWFGYTALKERTSSAAPAAIPSPLSIPAKPHQ
jgi:hypothetical protein